jgi:hypothetical protein
MRWSSRSARCALCCCSSRLAAGPGNCCGRQRWPLLLRALWPGQTHWALPPSAGWPLAAGRWPPPRPPPPAPCRCPSWQRTWASSPPTCATSGGRTEGPLTAAAGNAAALAPRRPCSSCPAPDAAPAPTPAAPTPAESPSARPAWWCCSLPGAPTPTTCTCRTCTTRTASATQAPTTTRPAWAPALPALHLASCSYCCRAAGESSPAGAAAEEPPPPPRRRWAGSLAAPTRRTRRTSKPTWAATARTSPGTSSRPPWSRWRARASS